MINKYLILDCDDLITIDLFYGYIMEEGVKSIEFRNFLLRTEHDIVNEYYPNLCYDINKKLLTGIKSKKQVKELNNSNEEYIYCKTFEEFFIKLKEYVYENSI